MMCTEFFYGEGYIDGPSEVQTFNIVGAQMEVRALKVFQSARRIVIEAVMALISDIYI